MIDFAHTETVTTGFRQLMLVELATAHCSFLYAYAYSFTAEKSSP